LSRTLARILVASLAAALVACGDGGAGGASDAGSDARDVPADVRDAETGAPDLVADLPPGDADDTAADPTDDPALPPDPGPDVPDVPPPVKGFKSFDLARVGNVRSMWASLDSSIWAVGDAGLALRWDGTDLVPVAPPPTGKDLFGVSGAEGTVVAVGAAGTAIAWRDGRWTDLAPPVTEDLLGVGVLSADEFYAVGKGATIVHWKAGAWDAMNAGMTHDLHAAWASSAGGVWAVGAWGSVLQLKGTVWVHQQVGAPGTRFRSIWRSPDGRMFAVGSGGAVAMHNGVVWKLQVTNDAADPPRDLHQVFGFASDEVYAVGDRGVVIRYDGDKWGVQTVAGPFNTSADLRGVAGLVLPDGTKPLFAAGTGSRALRAEGKSWADRRLGVTRGLSGVTVRADGEVVAVGAAGLVLTHRDGRFGTLDAGTKVDLLSASGDYVSGAAGTLRRRDGDVLVEVKTATGQDLSDVWDVADGAWAVGRAGGVFGVIDDVANAAGGAPGGRLEAVCTTPGGAIVVAGATGRVWWNDGDGFAEVPSGVTSDLWDLAPAGQDRVFAVGDNGLVLSCGKSGCDRLHEEPASFLYGVGGRADLMLAVGWAGTVLRLDGGAAEPLSTGQFRVYRAVAAGPAGPAALVGDDGTFAVYGP